MALDDAQTSDPNEGIERIDSIGAVPGNVIAFVPRILAIRHWIVPVDLIQDESGQRLKVAVTEPLDIEMIDTLGWTTNTDIVPVFAPEDEITRAIAKGYGFPVCPKCGPKRIKITESGLWDGVSADGGWCGGVFLRGVCPTCGSQVEHYES